MSQAPASESSRMRSTATRRLWPVSLFLLVSSAWGRDPIQVEFQMDSDPRIEYRPGPLVFPDELMPLWRKALERPEADLQRQAAEAVCEAHRQGMPQVTKMAPWLARVMNSPETHPAARIAAAKALAELDARDHADGLLQLALQADTGLSAIVEPALARWKSPGAVEVWQRRIADPKTPRRLRTLAIRGLGEANGTQAAEPLLALATNRLQHPDLRLEAAAAAARLRPAGLEPAAVALMSHAAADAVIDRLCGVRLLDAHATAAAVQALNAMARDSEPAVASAALERLLAIDPSHVLPHAEWGVAHADSGIRRIAARALTSHPTPERIRLLYTLLDDPHTGNRWHVRDSLYDLAQQEEFRGVVIELAMTRLQTVAGRGIRPSILLLGALDHKPAAERILTFFSDERSEVFVAAAWALRKLAVPELLPRLLQIAETETARRVAEKAIATGRDDWECLIFEVFGMAKYGPAEPLLRRYVPKEMSMGPNSRAAAIWALGHIHARKAPADLADALWARATDFDPMRPEAPPVRLHSLIALGRMASVKHLKQLLEMAPEPNFPFSAAAAWSAEQITGRPVPLPPPIARTAGPWFLEPYVGEPYESPPDGQ